MPRNRVAFVCGGRDFDDSDRLFAVLDAEQARHSFSCLVHGAARGADSLASAWAQSRGVSAIAFPADWAAFGRRAGPLRNRKMLDYLVASRFSGAVVSSFARQGGTGTRDMVRILQTAGFPVVMV